jgi:hypothetical protein
MAAGVYVRKRNSRTLWDIFLHLPGRIFRIYLGELYIFKRKKNNKLYRIIQIYIDYFYIAIHIFNLYSHIDYSL